MGRDGATKEIMCIIQKQPTSKGRLIQDDGNKNEDFRGITG